MNNLENESPETAMLKQEYASWKKLSDENNDPDEKEPEYQFIIDRRQDPESKVAEEDIVLIDLAGDPLEKFTYDTPTNFHSLEDERWIAIEVTPQNPYQPRIGIYNEGHSFYYTDCLNIYISNLGRAYQTVEWTQMLGLHYFSKQEITTEFETDAEAKLIEPFQPIVGRVLERLDFFKKYLQARGQQTSNS